MIPKKSPFSGFTLTQEHAARGGRNGKRGPSIKTIAREIGETILPETIKKKFKKKGYNLTGMTIAKAMTYAATIRAMDGSTADWKEFNDRHDGKASQHIDLTGGIDIKPNDELTKEFIKKHGLAQRS